jgi:hypothetical protein
MHHEQRVEYLPLARVSPAQRATVRWTRRPFDIRFVVSCSILRSFSKRNPSSSFGFELILSSMSGTGRDGDSRARGNRHTVGKCERAQSKTARENWEEAESVSVSRIRGAEEGVQRTGDETKP